eukprot:CAMPEP_0173107566 /NCGR_PEP_ID=MMETSP1102-20130122/41911_1 /TAXON_ID=49646 /ORGANISM="Geminigera sp., Strain Caron Lab Isolate" /LENGTH=51 /DNA_ID=CAMNT_0014005295 /DNA_START=49 /DNA_END=204 /DNA_ORIENTATION=+
MVTFLLRIRTSKATRGSSSSSSSRVLGPELMEETQAMALEAAHLPFERVQL